MITEAKFHVLKAEAESAFALVEDHGSVDASVPNDGRHRRQVGIVGLSKGEREKSRSCV